MDRLLSMSKTEYLELRGLNEFCDPVGVIYAGGSPLFNEATGRSISLEKYLKKKVVCLDL